MGQISTHVLIIEAVKGSPTSRILRILKTNNQISDSVGAAAERV